MAKTRFGAVITDARGSSDGVTYSRNRFGSYIRNRVAPVQPRTPFQLAVRATFTALSTAWRSLTDAERLDWSDLGSQIVRSDSLGNSYNLTGNQAYQSVNLNRSTLGQAPTSAAPALDTIPEILTATITMNIPGQLDLAYTAAGGLATNDFLVFATSPVSQGRNFFSRSEYRFIDSFLGNAASPVDIEAAYVAKWGTPDPDEKVSFLIVPVSVNRISGTPFRVDAIQP